MEIVFIRLGPRCGQSVYLMKHFTYIFRGGRRQRCNLQWFVTLIAVSRPCGSIDLKCTKQCRLRLLPVNCLDLLHRPTFDRKVLDQIPAVVYPSLDDSQAGFHTGRMFWQTHAGKLCTCAGTPEIPHARVNIRPAFDAAWRDDIMLWLHQAGVHGGPWRLIDDVMSDHPAAVRISLPTPDTCRGLGASWLEGNWLSPFDMAAAVLARKTSRGLHYFRDLGPRWRRGVCKPLL